MRMIIIAAKIACSIAVGFFAGPAAVYVFNHMPAEWLCEYGEKAVPEKRAHIKENPWRWVFSFGFICVCLRLSMLDLTIGTAQLAAAGLAACWLMLVISLADIKCMIIPDQFVIMLAISAIGFVPVWDTLQNPQGIWQPLIGMLIGGGFMLLCSLMGKLIFRKEAMGFGDVKLMAAIGLVLGIRGTIISMAAALLISGGAAAAGLMSGRWKKDDAKPLGPYLCGCAIAYIVLVIGGGVTL